MRRRLSSLSNSSACAVMSNVVVAGRCRRSASFVSSSACHDRVAIVAAIAIAASSSAGGMHLVDETGRERGFGVEDRPRVEHPARQAQPDELRETPVPAGAGDDAEAELGLAEARRGRCHTQVAGHRELAPAAHRPAVHRGDRGPAVLLEVLANPGVDRRNAASASRSSSSAMSAPAANVPGVVEWRTSTQGSRQWASRTRCNASIVASSSALRFSGRSRPTSTLVSRARRAGSGSGRPSRAAVRPVEEAPATLLAELAPRDLVPQ